jgi:hypothetical protein
MGASVLDNWELFAAYALCTLDNALMVIALAFTMSRKEITVAPDFGSSNWPELQEIRKAHKRRRLVFRFWQLLAVAIVVGVLARWLIR